MTAKFYAFVADLKDLCVKHGVQLSTTMYDSIVVNDLADGDPVLYGGDDSVVDRTTCLDFRGARDLVLDALGQRMVDQIEADSDATTSRMATLMREKGLQVDMSKVRWVAEHICGDTPPEPSPPAPEPTARTLRGVPGHLLFQLLRNRGLEGSVEMQIGATYTVEGQFTPDELALLGVKP